MPIRTGIYVHKPATVTIRPTRGTGRKLQLRAFRPGRAIRPAVGSYKLEPGIYFVTSESALEVTGRNIEVVTVGGGGKDPWPDPKVNVVALEPGASAASIKRFFEIAHMVDAPAPRKA